MAHMFGQDITREEKLKPNLVANPVFLRWHLCISLITALPPQVPSPTPPPRQQQQQRLGSGGVLNPPAAPPPTVEPTQLKASAAKEPSPPGNVPATAPGKCMVCLEDCKEVLGADWLHQEASVGGGRGGAAVCAVSACVSCLKTYFEVTSCFDHQRLLHCTS